MAASPARDGSKLSSMTSTPPTRRRSPSPPAYSGNPTPTATATADTAPGISKETSGASALAQFHSMGAGRAPRGRSAPDRPDLYDTTDERRRNTWNPADGNGSRFASLPLPRPRPRTHPHVPP